MARDLGAPVELMWDAGVSTIQNELEHELHAIVRGPLMNCPRRLWNRVSKFVEALIQH